MDWKSVERKIAEYLGCERQPVTGRAKAPLPDLVSDRLAVEVKARTRMPVLFEQAMDQAERSAEYLRAVDGKERTPVVVFHAKQGRYTDAVVCVWMGDFARLLEAQR